MAQALGFGVLVLLTLVLALSSCGEDPDERGAQTRFDEAVTLHEAGDLAGAVAVYDRVIALDPGHQGALLNRGRALLGMGRVEDALADLDRAVELDPEDGEALVARGRAAFVQGRFPAALQDYRHAIELDPLLGPAYEGRADAWAELGEVEAAVADYDNAIRLAPDDHDLYEARRMVRAAAGLEDDAAVDAMLRDLTREILASPDDTDVRFRRAVVFFASDEPELALADVDAVLAVERGDAAVHLLRGHALMAVGEDVEALAAYDRAVASAGEDPGDAPAFAARGVLYESIGSPADAVADYEEALRRDPDDLGTTGRLAWVLATTSDDGVRDGERALALATKARDAGVEDIALALDTLAAALAEIGRFDEAVSTQRRALEKAPLALQEGMQARLGEYRSGRPHRE